MIVMSSLCTDPFDTTKSPLSLVITFVLKPILSDINTVDSAFLWL